MDLDKTKIPGGLIFQRKDQLENNSVIIMLCVMCLLSLLLLCGLNIDTVYCKI